MEPHRTGRNEPRALLIEPGRTLGPYLVLSTLSCGPRSIVYMAQDLSLDRPVALKTAPRGAISVIAEGRVLARFSHPHIVTLHGLWSEPSILILEYLVGETLKARHERLGAPTEDRVAQWMQEVLSALEAIHGQGLAHGAIRADGCAPVLPLLLAICLLRCASPASFARGTDGKTIDALLLFGCRVSERAD